MKKITRKEAIRLYDSKFWEPLNYQKRAMFQLFTDKLCMPFDVFHEAVEESLGRAVYTHEFGTAGTIGLKKEMLGEKEAPTFQEIVNLIPKDKQLIVISEASSD